MLRSLLPAKEFVLVVLLIAEAKWFPGRRGNEVIRPARFDKLKDEVPRLDAENIHVLKPGVY
jgi:hypothetical protein